jgi:hypothetical protein
MKPKNNRVFLYLFLALVFLAGIYVCLTQGILINHEGLENQDTEPEKPSCPDMLIKRGNSLYLYNTKKPILDGKNPIVFKTLDEYIVYYKEERKKGVNCPVMYLQEENNAQGQDVLRMRPSPFYVEGGLPPLPMNIHDNTVATPVADASRMNPPYNENNFASFDPYGQYVGVFTNIDEIHNSTMTGEEISDNPMDPNWGGVDITNKSVLSGKYAGSEVSKPIYPAVIPQ